MTLALPIYRLYLPVIVYMAGIFLLSSSKGIDLPFIDKPSVDKLYHTALYAPLAYLIVRALEQGFRLCGRKLIIWGIIIAILYGWSDEVHQLFVPGRYFSYWDLLANSMGAVLGTWIYLKIRL